MHVAAILNQFDLRILGFLAGFAGRSRIFDHLINLLSRLDLFKGIALMLLFWFVWTEAPDEPAHAIEERQALLVRVLLGTILLGGLSRLLQIMLTVHQRPVLANLGLQFPLNSFDVQNLNAWNSFPSDHAMYFCGLATGLWVVNRTIGVLALLWTLLIIDLPRVYLGVHYPSDVIAGAILGIAGMAAFLAIPARRFDRMLGAWRAAHSGLFFAALFFASDEAGHLLAEMRELATSALHVLSG